MKKGKTYEEINEKIKKGKAVVLTAEEVKDMSESEGVKEVAKKVDVVTTGTFSPMCSTGAFINFGHSEPPIKMKKAWLNNVPAYAGLAAVDVYLGAAELSEKRDRYGGAHVIQELISGKNVDLKAIGGVTDCYPRGEVSSRINLNSVNECFLFNPRNVYQNYAAATNSTGRKIYTYMGMLLPRYGNVTYSTSGELSPLLNDPNLKTIGVGTRIFLGGGEGFISWNGTQFNTCVERDENDIPIGPARTLSLIGDLKGMDGDFIRAAVIENYGVSIYLGVGIPIPVLNEEIARAVSVRDKDIKTILCDYGSNNHPEIKRVNYEELKSGEIELRGKKIRTGSFSSIFMAGKISEILKKWISGGEFLISRPVKSLPEEKAFRNMKSKEE